jgi:hypothetical protein
MPLIPIGLGLAIIIPANIAVASPSNQTCVFEQSPIQWQQSFFECYAKPSIFKINDLGAAGRGDGPRWHRGVLHKPLCTWKWGM